jgi:hypothetical protein
MSALFAKKQRSVKAKKSSREGKFGEGHQRGLVLHNFVQEVFVVV